MARPLPASDLDREFEARIAARTPRPMVWPVYGFSGYFRPETVAEFFSFVDAACFAMRPESFGGEPRNLYIGESRVARVA